MLQILLILLKGIGILLALLIGLILLVLAAPVRYSFRLHADAHTLPHGQIRVTWLFCIFYMKASYIEEVFDYRVRIFGYQILGNQKEFLDRKRRKKDRKRKKGEKRRQSRATTAASGQEAVLKIPDQDATPEIPERDTTPEIPDQAADPNLSGPSDSEAQQTEKSMAESAVTPKQSEKGNAKKKKRKPDPGGIWTTFGKKAEAARNAWNEYHGERLLDFAKQVIIKILRHVLPRKLRGHIRFGFDDPAVTGIVTGMAAMLYPRYGDTFSLEPDFQERCFEADCQGKGRIHPGFFLYIGVIALRNRDVRMLVKKVL